MTSTTRFAPFGQRQGATPTRARRVARVALAVALLTAIAQLPGQLASLRPRLPVLSLWSQSDAQYRLQLRDVPYDLLRTADAVLPRDAAVLLVTSGHDVRHREYTIFHRALYFLAPRPVWWLTPAPPDRTWESRWWISVPLTPDSVRTIALKKRASYVLVCALPQPVLAGRKIIELGDSYLLQVDESIPSPLGQPVHSTSTSALWPAQMVAALGTILLLGYVALAVVARTGYCVQGIESVALAWPLGAGLISVGMLWLNALGVSLNGQIITLTVLTVGTWAWTRRWVRYALNSQPRVSDTQDPTPKTQHRVLRFSLPLLLLAFLALQIALVTVTAIGQPLHIWDSWVIWGMKARAIFLEGYMSPAVYADPSRTVTQLDYPLLVPLVEAWLYGWLGVPDDRLVGVVSILFYLTLTGVCYSAVRRRGATQGFALGVSAVVASVPHLAGVFGFVNADAPLAAFVTIAVVYLSEWLDNKPPGTLTIAAVAAGLMPWTKREGLVLFAVLCLVILVAGRGARRTGLGVAALFFAAILLSGPWWGFITWNGITDAAFLPVTLATFYANLARLPSIGWRVLSNLLSPRFSFVWPLSVLCCLLRERGASFATGSPARRTADLLPMAAFLYLSLMSLGYVFSAFEPYQQHVTSSIFRLIVHVVPLPILWIAYHDIE